MCGNIVLMLALPDVYFILFVSIFITSKNNKTTNKNNDSNNNRIKNCALYLFF